ncbi:WXG100 family type VII secretion target [Nocardia sp. NPDC005978]|uniref:WXG100 family type VII secretion target n=1 Tax=Nocardia sp. NPDC005978 TaxID=3156725 RepID=UPI0033A63B0F
MSGGSLNSSDSNAVVSNHDQAEAAKNHMADVIATVRSVISKTTTSVDSARPGFKGAAAVSFNAAADAWDQEAVRLNTKLDAIEQQVGTGVAQFRSTDAENEGGFKQYTSL